MHSALRFSPEKMKNLLEYIKQPKNTGRDGEGITSSC
jgi:hypothetical protein